MRLVQRRVDWLEIAFRVERIGSGRDRLKDVVSDLRRRIADQEARTRAEGCSLEETMRVTRVPSEVAGVSFAAREAGQMILFERTDGLVVVLHIGALGGWSVVVRYTGSWFLGDPDHLAAWRLACKLAAALGWDEQTRSRAEESARVRRLDLAADFEGFDLARDDLDRWVKPRRGSVRLLDEHHEHELREPVLSTRRLERGTVLRDDVVEASMPIATRWSGREVTGMTVCPGNPLQLTIYDKTIELAQQSREKREAEEARWRDGGWGGYGHIRRVEYRIRADVLAELRSDKDGPRFRDDPELLLHHLDTVWSYATGWARIVDPSTATRLDRCAIDPRWRAVLDVTWSRREPPAVRRRVRTYAEAPQVVGTLLSFAAGRGVLPPLNTICDENGEVLDDPEQLLESDRNVLPGGAKKWLGHLIDHLARPAAAELTSQLVEQRMGRAERQSPTGPSDAARSRAASRALADWAGKWLAYTAKAALLPAMSTTMPMAA